MMDKLETHYIKSLKGEFIAPGDKSISHRAIIISGLCSGESEIVGCSNSLDCANSINAMKMCGVYYENKKNKLIVKSSGELIEPIDIIDVGNSGTTIRILSGVLSGYNFLSILTGDESIKTRPMLRVIEPLRLMGAKILARCNDKLAPIIIKGGNLTGVDYTLKVPSAQVKSAIIFAGLRAKGETKINEKLSTRDHTERMLKFLGANINIKNNTVVVKGGTKLIPQKLIIPGDISSASFFIVASLITKESDLIIKNVGLNKT
jgi:3-phosphoshikimate 1-carboxyvinyltransferase